MEFETKVKVDLYTQEDIGQVDDINIRWGLEIEERSWGVKDFSIYVPDQEIELYFTVHDPTTGDEIEQKRTVRLENVAVTLNGYAFPGALQPDVLSFFQGRVELEF